MSTIIFYDIIGILKTHEIIKFLKIFDNNVLFGIYYSSNQVVMITDCLIAYTKLKFVGEV